MFTQLKHFTAVAQQYLVLTQGRMGFKPQGPAHLGPVAKLQALALVPTFVAVQGQAR